MAREQPGETLNKTRLWTSAISAAAMMAAGIAISSPANAAVSPSTIYVSNCTSTTAVIRDGANGGGSVVTNVTSTALMDELTINNECTISITVEGFISGNLLRFTRSVPSNASTKELIFQVVEFKFKDTNSGNVLTTLTGSSTGGGGGGTSSGAAASAPVEVSLALDLAASGATCTEGSAATGVTGAWMTLPDADDCSSTTTPDARLLGWSTTADFPEVIAQRQIDNGWGAYEMFDDEGRLTAVFIPAGQATFVSGPNSLHPIWAS